MKTIDPDRFIDRLLVGHAAHVMADFPDNSVDLVITSPPYWTAVSYDGGCPWASYDAYLDDIQMVWKQCARVLRPNGKLCINSAAMPIPQKLVHQDTRRIENLPADFYRIIIGGTDLRFTATESSCAGTVPPCGFTAATRMTGRRDWRPSPLRPS
jgi:modification methylase